MRKDKFQQIAHLTVPIEPSQDMLWGNLRKAILEVDIQDTDYISFSYRQTGVEINIYKATIETEDEYQKRVERETEWNNITATRVINSTIETIQALEHIDKQPLLEQLKLKINELTGA